jgi:integrase
MKLGTYVVIRPRAAGLHSVAFEVPKRLRPEGWPPTIPLPAENRNGNLEDAEEISRIRADAAALLEQLNKHRAGTGSPQTTRTWRALIAIYENSSGYASLKDASKKNYAYYCSRLVKYFDDHPKLQPATIRESELEAVLAIWNGQDTKYNQFNMLRLLLNKAVREGWRSDDPTAEIKCKRPKKKDRHVIIWEAEDVAAMQRACLEAGYISIAVLIQTQWEIGQRLTDARQFRFGEEYQDGIFRFNQSKTGAYVTIPVSTSLKELLESYGEQGEFLFVSPGSKQPFSESYLSAVFGRIRGQVTGYENRPLCLRHLRHSCVVQLARSGCTVPEIASITGHSMGSVHNIIEHYLPRDNVLARTAVEKRLRAMLHMEESRAA